MPIKSDQKLSAKPMPIFIQPLREKIRAKLKTQTRRLSGLEEINKAPDDWKLTSVFPDEFGKRKIIVAEFTHKKSDRMVHAFCPYGLPDEIRYLREPLKNQNGWTKYRDDNESAKSESWGIAPWKWQKNTLPQIHMERRLARTFCKMVNIGCERLKDISESDALAEGIEFMYEFNKKSNFDCLTRDKIGMPFLCIHHSAAKAFFCLFESVHGKSVVELNPFVWKLKFEIAE